MSVSGLLSDQRLSDRQRDWTTRAPRSAAFAASVPGPVEFCNFERTSHDKLAESYYDAFSAVTDGAIEPLLKAAHVGNGTRLLDVAVIGIDIAPAMIELAHTLHPHLDFREGSAEELPLDSSSFDAVISGFGVGHFSRPERVLVNLHVCWFQKVV